ncbi:hypothetical protein LINGRAHAP2_LOCUS8640 [Linum grandiflorum]
MQLDTNTRRGPVRQGASESVGRHLQPSAEAGLSGQRILHERFF